MDCVYLLNKIQGYCKEAEGIPDYINLLENTQKRSKCINTSNLIMDATLIDMAMTDMLANGQFPWTEEDWDLPDKGDKTWSKRNEMYLLEHGHVRARQPKAAITCSGAQRPMRQWR